MTITPELPLQEIFIQNIILSKVKYDLQIYDLSLSFESDQFSFTILKIKFNFKVYDLYVSR